ncbi:uncharacterized protein HMPREF1541_07110 [Cyphellophora europaea CBS 101466]|uniref:Heterokaryon incompatibility domain-containing protein n=1 Tax=Cyphellophora europaea (strain CBS 101466) TaxID=1220924 RepID=W2RP78_CYPE1|nr:uncharacterized protein HMPREF1541_07110 [Cyphellophora europaea CBS 101466]ETN37488.1 hypothetical protein HMPREF1541_07110 [Cyphellophora europaea CBS 101466]
MEPGRTDVRPNAATPSQTRDARPAPLKRLSFDYEGHPLYQQLTIGHAIRLVEIARGATSDPISIRLSIHELSHTPDYDAISYVWGGQADHAVVECNGKDLNITHSLEAALRRVRLLDRPRLVWADAVCINQRNLREKSHHVAFMDLVYRLADHVLIHLGPAEDSVGRDVHELIEEYVVRSTPYHGDITAMPVLPRDDPILDDVRWRSLARVMGLPWFSRAWVIQEAGVARDPRALLGSFDLDYRQLMQLTRWVVRCASQLQSRSSIPLETIHTDWERWSAGWQEQQTYRYSLVDFLSHAKPLGCHESRDHVYAFLGHPLCQQEGEDGIIRPIIRPDYSMPLEEVYRRMTEWMLSHEGMKVLSAAEHNEVSLADDSTPSWVVRWNIHLVWSSFGYYHPFYYRASGSEPEPPQNKTQPLEKPPCKCVLDGPTCTISAIRLDTITQVYQFSADDAHWPVLEVDAKLRTPSGTDLTRLLARIFAATQDSTHFTSVRYTTSDNTGHCLDALSLTLTAGLTNYESAEDDLPTHRADFQAFWGRLLRRLRELPAELQENTVHSSALPSCPHNLNDQLAEQQQQQTLPRTGSGSADRFLYDMSLSCKGRAFFITNGGFWGVGPHVTKMGDECFVVMGARVPFVVRRHLVKAAAEEEKHGDVERAGISVGEPAGAGDCGERYRLVGEAYVHGVMRGEAVTAELDSAGGVGAWRDLVLV